MENKPNKSIGYLAPQYYEAKPYSYYGNIEAVNIVLIKFAMLAKFVEEPDWYVKGAALYFTYGNEFYVIEPGCVDTTAGRFDRISRELEDALYEVGAYDMFYAGMMD